MILQALLPKPTTDGHFLSAQAPNVRYRLLGASIVPTTLLDKNGSYSPLKTNLVSSATASRLSRRRRITLPMWMVRSSIHPRFTQASLGPNATYKVGVSHITGGRTSGIQITFPRSPSPHPSHHSCLTPSSIVHSQALLPNSSSLPSAPPPSQ